VTVLRDAALAYAAAGYQVFPLRGKLPYGNCPGCEPRSPRYRLHQPAGCGHELCHGLYAATTDPTSIARWWARWPQANIGARVPPSLLVLDVDPRHGGAERLAQLEAAHGPLPPTRVSVSGRGDGGQHRWFLHPGGQLAAARLGAGVDLKTHAGYVLLPPSRHPATGRPYQWAQPTLDPAPPARLAAAAAGPTASRPRPGPPPTPATVVPGPERRRGVQRPHELGGGAGPARLDQSRPGSGRRWCSLAPPRGQQPQERHHPPRAAVRLLGGHPVCGHPARRPPRLYPLPRLGRA
jgi:hypothetical protein